MKPMTIIHLKHRLTQFLNAATLNQQAKSSQFMQRIRGIQPLQLVTSLVAAFSQGNTASIADLLRQFNGMQLSEDDFVAYKPFHNQLRKPGFATFMAQLARQTMPLLIKQYQGQIPSKFQRFERILLHDGSSFAIHDKLKDEFPGRFHTVSPAAVECHVTMSLLEQTPVSMTIAADTISEHDFRPAATQLQGQLLLADAGYLDQAYYHEIDQHSGFYLVRGKKSLNPTIAEARNQHGRLLPKLAGKKLKAVDRRTNRSDVLDMVVRSGKFRYRIIRRWFAPEQRFVLWLTNLPREEFSATDIMLLYRCRWQIELLFKELKSHTNLRKFNTEQKAIVEGLIWTSLLTLLLKRLIVNSASSGLSLFKAAKNADVWFCPVVTAISQRAMQEIEHHLDWAFQYLRRNAQPSQQSKSRQGNGLRDIYDFFNA